MTVVGVRTQNDADVTSATTGGHVWNACLTLLQFIDWRISNMIKDCEITPSRRLRILELGIN
jgi:hypothetical protein